MISDDQWTIYWRNLTDWCTRRDSAASAGRLYALIHLFDLAIERMVWDGALPAIAEWRATAPVDPRAARWMAFIAQYAALRSGPPAEQLATLTQLAATAEDDPPLHERVLHAIGIGHALLGRYDAALTHWRAALAIAEHNDDPVRCAYLLLAIGTAHNDLDEYPAAMAYSEQSLALARSCDAPDRIAHACYEIGNNALHLGEWARADAALAEAEAIYTARGLTPRLAMVTWAHGIAQQMRGDDAAAERSLRFALTELRARSPTITIDALAHLGLTYASQARNAEASAVYREAIAHAEQHALRHWLPIYRGLLASHLARQGATDAALDLFAAALRDIEELRDAQQIDAVRMSLFGTTQYVFEALFHLRLARGEHAQAFVVAEQARARGFRDQLSAMTGQLPIAHDTGITLAKTQALLADDDLVLAYMTTGGIPAGSHWLNQLVHVNPRLLGHVLAPPAIVLFAITAATVDVLHLTGDPNMLRASPGQRDPTLDLLQSDRSLRRLYTMLIAPVAAQIARARRVLIVPHGSLHSVPFAALRGPHGRYLRNASGPALLILPSVTMLARPPRATPPVRAGLAIGYNDPHGAGLAYAEAEALLVAGLMGGEAWVGPQPKRELLLARGRMPWLHIAGHARVDPQHPLRSQIVLGEDDTLDAASVLARARVDSDLVTLSACMSGYSQVLPGDELIGLLRAFLIAGARNTICSQTRIPDTVTFLVMARVYELLAAGASAATALQQAVAELQTMTTATVIARLAALGQPTADLHITGDTPFAAPQFWGGLVCVGG